MTEQPEEDTTITIDDKEYKLSDFNDEQKTILSHISDLDMKSKNTQFNLDQLNIARQAFMDMLKKSLDI